MKRGKFILVLFNNILNKMKHMDVIPKGIPCNESKINPTKKRNVIEKRPLSKKEK